MLLSRLASGFFLAALGIGITVARAPGDGVEVMLVLLMAAACGLVAGSWWSLPLVPVAAWLAIGAVSATDCPDCGGGGEPLPGGVQAIVVLVITVALAAAAAVGVAIGRFAGFALSRSAPATLTAPPPLLLVAVPGLLALVGVVLLVHRDRTLSDRNGDVLFATGDVRYRAGPAWDGSARRSLSQSEVERFDRFHLAWLGPSFAGYNLTSVIDGGYPGVAFIYGTCGPAPCPVPLSVLVNDACGFPLQPGGASPQELVTLPSGATARADGTLVWTGRIVAQVHAVDPSLLASAAAALVPIRTGSLGPPAADPCAK